MSVLTVQKNESDALEETIRSVVHQDYPNIEYIIVDENSNSATLEIINADLDVHSKFLTSDSAQSSIMKM